jgi:hypothetical protein
MAERTKEEIRKLSAPLSLSLTPWDWLKKAQLLRDASNQLFVRFENDQLAHDERFERELSFATHTSVLMTLALDAPDDSVLMMLFGFAIENLLKGLYVSTLKNAKRPRTLNELGVSRHGLAVIAKKVEAALGEQFSESEIKLLTDLEQTIVWRGRYPSPVDADRLISTSSDTLPSAPSFQYPEHHFAASKLYDRLEALLIPRAPFSVRKGLLGKTYLGRMPDDAG